MFRAGLLSILLLLAVMAPASAAPLTGDEIPLPVAMEPMESRIFAGPLPDPRSDGPEHGHGSPPSDSDPAGPHSSGGPSEGGDDGQGDSPWTVVVRKPTFSTSAVPVTLPPLSGLIEDVEKTTPDLTVRDPVDLLLAEETEDAPAPQAASSAPPVAPKVPAAFLVVGAATAATFAVFFFSGSTSAAGAGLSGSSAAGRKALPIFSPLFTRFEGKKVLEHPNRAQLYSLVASTPGVRLQDLCEETHLSRTAVTHHMRLLEQQHLVVSKRVGRSRHFYENGGRFERQQKDAYAILTNDRSRSIAQFIREHPGSIQKDLCEALDMRASIAHWHVKRLAEAHLVEPVRQGRTVSYFPAEAMAEVTL